MSNQLTDLLHIKHPVIMAPMFLVSNTKMVIEAMNAGIAGCIPALNYRTLEELRAAARELKAAKPEGGSFGFNLIVNKSNVKYKGQLEVLCEEGCDFIITSLGSPEETIRQAHKVGIKVFCDVVDLKFAKKVEGLNADAVIAVNNQAGGHRGDMSPKEQKEAEAQMQEKQQNLKELTAQAEFKLVQKEQELSKPIIDRFNAALKKVAEEKGYAYIVDKKMFLYMGGGIDATEDIKAAM